MPKRPPPSPSDLALRRDIGNRIASARVRAGLTQRELARTMGFSQSWLQSIESGQNTISAGDLRRIARLLEMPAEYFLDAKYDPSLKRPKNRLEWDLLYPEQPELAAAHAELDNAFSRLRPHEQ